MAQACIELAAFITEGHTGVSLFIVLSGFILSFGFEGGRIDYRNFITNRFLRIFPLMTILVLCATYTNYDNKILQILAPSLLLQNSFVFAMHDITNMTGMLWTISVEFQFSLVAPFLIYIVAKEGVRRFAFPFAITIILRLIALLALRHNVEGLWVFPFESIIGRINQFLIGIVVGVNWRGLSAFLRQGRSSHRRLLMASGPLLIALLSYRLSREGGGEHVWYWWRVVEMDMEGFGWTLFIVGHIVTDPLKGYSKVSTCVRAVGIASFSFYLLHWPILNLAISLCKEYGTVDMASRSSMLIGGILIVLPLSLAVAALSYWSIERPFLLMRKLYVPH